jgi:ACT domain-containing protein
MSSFLLELADIQTDVEIPSHQTKNCALSFRLDHHLSELKTRLRTDSISMIANQLASKSYWHPNGFLKIPVRQDADNAFFRIHCWGDGSFEKQSLEDIHSHRWNYFSKILCGRLKIQYFTETQVTGTKYSRYVCSPNENGIYAMRFDGSTNLEKKETTILNANGVHSGITNTIHSTRALGADRVITAFLQSSPASSRSHVYRKAGLFQSANESKRKASSLDVENVLLEIAKM